MTSSLKSGKPAGNALARKLRPATCRNILNWYHPALKALYVSNLLPTKHTKEHEKKEGIEENKKAER
jgi:hypothetical protein